MLNKTLCLVLLCVIFHTVPSFGQIRVKRIFQDNKYNNRTNVIKEEQENDYHILDEQFGDAKVGEVVRIAIEKPKAQKSPKPPKPPKPPAPPKPKVVKTKPVKEVKKLPKVKVEKEVFTAKGAANVAPPAPRRRHFSASPSEYAPHKTYQAQLPKVKFWKKKKRRKRKNKSGKYCYRFN